MKVLAVASEIYPLIKTGGLADVAGALPAALRAQSIDVTTLVPGYPQVTSALRKVAKLHDYENLFGGPAAVIAGEAKGLSLLVVDAPHLFNRPDNPYLGPDGKDWPDNARRFAALARAAAEVGRGQFKNTPFDLLHLHDWQAALAAAYVRLEGGPPSVVTIHNIAFQGKFPASVFSTLGLPPTAFSIDGLEFYGGVSYLKGGLQFADAITTVSPSYAREICTPEFGMGLDGVLRARRDVLTGIVNGIDMTAWNPETDPYVPARYGAKSLGRRGTNRRAIEERFGLDCEDGLLHCVVSRLTWQKGMDVLAACADDLAASGARLALIGVGESEIEAALVAKAAQHRGRIGVVIGYDEDLSHLLQSGSDTIVIPSRFEPCGLTQLYGLRYGCIPIVARTGGLTDTVIDANDAALSAGAATGFQFSPVDVDSLSHCLRRAAGIFADRPVWSRMQRRGMATDVSWRGSAQAYADVYRKLTGGQGA